jgi:hypothetical protein
MMAGAGTTSWARFDTGIGVDSSVGGAGWRANASNATTKAPAANPASPTNAVEIAPDSGRPAAGPVRIFQLLKIGSLNG